MVIGKVFDAIGRGAIRSQGFKDGKNGRDMSTIILSHPDPDAVNDYIESYERGQKAHLSDSARTFADKS